MCLLILLLRIVYCLWFDLVGCYFLSIDCSLVVSGCLLYVSLSVVVTCWLLCPMYRCSLCVVSVLVVVFGVMC